MASQTLEMLRRLETKIGATLSELRDLTPHVCSIEVQLGSLVSAMGRVNERIDRMDVRLERIERRLDLRDEKEAGDG